MVQHFGESESAWQNVIAGGGKQGIQANYVVADNNHSGIAVVVLHCAD
jgi:hypothetical protein